MRNQLGRIWWMAVGYCFLILAPAMAQQAGSGTGDGIETDKTFTGTVTGKTNGDFTIVKAAGGDNATGTFLGVGTVGQVALPIRAGISSCDKCKGKTIKVGFWGNAFPAVQGTGIITGAKGNNLHFGGAIAVGVQNCPSHVFSQVNTLDKLEHNGVTYLDETLPKLDGEAVIPDRLKFTFNSGTDANTSAVFADFPGLNLPINGFPKTGILLGKIVGQKPGRLILRPGQTYTETESFISVIKCACDPNETNPVAFVEWTLKLTFTLGDATTSTGVSTLEAISIVCPNSDPVGYGNALNLVVLAEGKKGPDRFAEKDFTPQ